MSFIKSHFPYGMALLIGAVVFAAQSSSAIGPDDIQSYQAPAEPAGEKNNDQLFPQEPKGAINLRQALSLALMRNHSLRAFAWEIRAREANTLQVGLLPNPTASALIENAQGTDSYNDYNRAETTLSLSQLIELGGKRSKRAKVAKFETVLAGWDYKTARIDTFAEVTKSFIDALTAQEQLALAKKLVQLAQKALNTATVRVAAGKAPPIDQTKAKVEFSISQIRLRKARARVTAAYKRLAELWGSARPVFEKVDGSLDVVGTIPQVEQLVELIGRNPEIARWDEQLDKYRAAVQLERAGRIPDLTLEGGVRQLRETQDTALVMGFSIPIQIFNRNQGALREARFNLTRAREQRQATISRIRSTLAQSYQELSSGNSAALALRDDVLPGAQLAFDTANVGYREGKFSFLEVLDAQRVLFEVKSEFIDTLSAYHKAVADVERLIAGGINLSSMNGEK